MAHHIAGEEHIRYGTYTIKPMPAAGWLRILTALGAMRDEYQRLGLYGLAEDAERTLSEVQRQVLVTD